jgi:hypothetical protein
MVLNNLNVRGCREASAIRFCRTTNAIAQAVVASHPAFDLTHEIAAAESKDIPDNRITSGGR